MRPACTAREIVDEPVDEDEPIEAEATVEGSDLDDREDVDERRIPQARYSYSVVKGVSQDDIVLAAINQFGDQFGGLTNQEIERILRLQQSSASARCNGLRKAGLIAIIESGKRQVASGRMATLHVVTPAGRARAMTLPPILVESTTEAAPDLIETEEPPVAEVLPSIYWHCRRCSTEVEVPVGGRAPSVCSGCGQIGTLFAMPEDYEPAPRVEARARQRPPPFGHGGPPGFGSFGGGLGGLGGPNAPPMARPYAGGSNGRGQAPQKAMIVDPAEVEREPLIRSVTGVSGLDHVTGGGIAQGYVVMVAGPPGCGKCLGLGTPVMMFDGSIRPVEDVRLGDTLMGPDSRPRKVLATNVGRGPLYQINPVKGDPWVCNDAHVLTITGTREKIGTTIDVPLHQHISYCETTGQRLDRDWKLVRAPVTFAPEPTEVDPYLVGVWIGDGTFGAPEITNREPEIIQYCQEIAPQYRLEVVLREVPQGNTWNIRFRSYSKRKPGEAPRKRRTRAEMGARNIKKNRLTDFFRTRCEDSGEKTIPREYLINSEAVRLDLLAGLIDTDGYLEPNGTYQISTVSDRLRDQYLFLARSLGFAAYATKKTVKIKKIDFTGDYWILTISGHLDRIPCRVARRRAKPRRQIKRVLVTGFSATPIGDGDYYGFTLDGDGRFLLGDFTVTHNSTICTQAASGLAHLGTHFGAGVAYGAAEEDSDAVIETADRVALANFKIVLATSCQTMIEGLDETDAVVWVIDSLMAITSDDVDGEPGLPSQINACSTLLYQRAHAMPGSPFEGMERRSIYLVAHGTKDGNMAGPLKALHSVDGGVLMEHVDPTGADTKGNVPWGPAKDQTRPTGFVSARVYRKMRKASNRPISYFLMQPEFLDAACTQRNPVGGRLDRVQGPL